MLDVLTAENQRLRSNGGLPMGKLGSGRSQGKIA